MDKYIGKERLFSTMKHFVEESKSLDLHTNTREQLQAIKLQVYEQLNNLKSVTDYNLLEEEKKDFYKLKKEIIELYKSVTKQRALTIMKHVKDANLAVSVEEGVKQKLEDNEAVEAFGNTVVQKGQIKSIQASYSMLGELMDMVTKTNDERLSKIRTISSHIEPGERKKQIRKINMKNYSLQYEAVEKIIKKYPESSLVQSLGLSLETDKMELRHLLLRQDSNAELRELYSNRLQTVINEQAELPGDMRAKQEIGTPSTSTTFAKVKNFFKNIFSRSETDEESHYQPV